jgi:hypothetical protein
MQTQENLLYKGIPWAMNIFLYNKGVFKGGTHFQNPVKIRPYSDWAMGWTAEETRFISRQGQHIPPQCPDRYWGPPILLL